MGVFGIVTMAAKILFSQSQIKTIGERNLNVIALETVSILLNFKQMAGVSLSFGNVN